MMYRNFSHETEVTALLPIDGCVLMGGCDKTHRAC